MPATFLLLFWFSFQPVNVFVFVCVYKSLVPATYLSSWIEFLHYGTTWILSIMNNVVNETEAAANKNVIITVHVFCLRIPVKTSFFLLTKKTFHPNITVDKEKKTSLLSSFQNKTKNKINY